MVTIKCRRYHAGHIEKKTINPVVTANYVSMKSTIQAINNIHLLEYKKP